MFKKILLTVSCVLVCTVSLAWAEPQNVIFLIGDGLGFEQVKAAGMYADGEEGHLIFETFPYQAEIATYSASSPVTDSAAASTAIATGFKVDNGVISVDLPGKSGELYTLLEYYRDKSKSTGLVTTSYITDATLAAFGAHEVSRKNANEIAGDYLQQTRPNVLLGGGGKGISASAATAAGYTVVTDNLALQALNTDLETLVYGRFGNSKLPYEYDYFTGSDNGYDLYPHLSAMTATTLDILDNDPEGFFLVVEGGRIDHAGHKNNINRNIFETLEFNNAVQVVYNWARTRSDTLIIVTADHETGGLTVLQNNGQGEFPRVSWSTTGHTGVNVPLYAWGENAYRVSGILNNTNLFEIVTGDCFIATVAYGSYWKPNIVTLDQFRDKYLLANKLGMKFAQIYYKYSPLIADTIAEQEVLKFLVRLGLIPLIGFSWLAIHYGMMLALLAVLSILTIIIGGACLIIKTKAS